MNDILIENKKLSLLLKIFQVGSGKNLGFIVFLKEVLNIILTEFDFSSGGIYLLDDSRQTAELVYYDNIADDVVPLLISGSVNKYPYSELIINRQIVDSKTYYNDFEPLMKKMKVKYFAAFPIISGDTVIGSINIASDVRTSLSEENKQILSYVGAGVGSIIEKIIVEEQLVKSEVRYRNLYEKSMVDQKKLNLLNDDISITNKNILSIQQELFGMNNKLKVNEKKLARIIEFLPISVLIMNNDTVEIINQKFVETFGYNENDIQDLTGWFELTIQSDDERRKVMVYTDKENISSDNFVEAVFTTAFNTKKTIMVYSHLFETYRILILLDVSDVVKMRSEIISQNSHLLAAYSNIEKMNSDLEMSNKALQVTNQKLIESQSDLIRKNDEVVRIQKYESMAILAGGLAHDFNNILTAILGNVSLVKMSIDSSGDKNKDIEDYLNNAENAIARAKDLTGQLLSFTKGKMMNKSVVCVNDIIKESVNFVLHGFDISVIIDLSENLKNSECDYGQISQVIHNLMINSIQAMNGKGEIIIATENVEFFEDQNLYLKKGRYVKITVKDNGKGISRDVLPKIFDPFFTTKKDGSGLGLTTTFNIIRKHDGYISVDSKMDEGTLFNIYLPSSEKNIEVIHSIENNITNQSGSVLVVDDEESIRVLCARMLRQLGYNADSVSDGDAALIKYKESMNTKKYDFIILDLTIPGKMGGKEAIKRLLEIDPDAAAIVSSGYSNDPILSNYSEYGFKGCLIKPYRIEELFDAIKKIK